VKKWPGRIALGFLGLLLVAMAAGAIAEQLARRQAVHAFPPPGRMVDIGGRRIQLDCRGQGLPVVVFEANDLGGSLGWSAVQAEVANTRRACSYSRAGIMWSDPADGTRDDKAIADDLHAVLRAAGEHPPFVLVGHSLGNLYNVAYTKYFGDEVAGLVMVDPAHPDQARQIEAITHRPFSVLAPATKILTKLAWSGLPRLLIAMDDMPKGMEGAAAYGPQSLVAMARELDNFDKTLADAATWHALGARPLYILTAMAPASPAALQETQMTAAEDLRFRLVWKILHDDEAKWSSASQHRLVPDSGHRIQSETPQLVIHAIESVVDSVRSGQRPRP